MATSVQTPATLTAPQYHHPDNPPCPRCHGRGVVTTRGGYCPDEDDCPNCGGTGRMSNAQTWRLGLDQAIAAGDHSRAYDMVDALIGEHPDRTVMSCDGGAMRVVMVTPKAGAA